MASELQMSDVDGVPVEFGVNRDGTVRISIGPSVYQRTVDEAIVADLDTGKCEEFTRLYFEAIRQAQAKERELEADGG